MDKPRVMPLLAGAVLAVGLSACQNMGGQESRGAAQTSSAAPAATAPAGQQAASADLVRDVQRGLSTRGYDVGPQDGVFGTSTEHALRRFQQDQHIGASGQIDAQTLAALGVVGGVSGQRATASTVPSREYVPTSKRQGASAAEPRARSSHQMASAQVRNVQQNLADRGYDPGKVDGHWGPRTQTALRDFQRDQNLRTSGRPDAQTLAALGVETGSPATQTGQLPEAQRRGTVNAPEPQNNPSDTDLQQRDVTNPEQQQGLLPPTGSQAPGAARESERAPVAPGGAPDTRPNPPDVVPAPAPANPQ